MLILSGKCLEHYRSKYLAIVLTLFEITYFASAINTALTPKFQNLKVYKLGCDRNDRKLATSW